MRHRWSPPGGRSAHCGPIVSDAQRRGGRRGPATTPEFTVEGPLELECRGRQVPVEPTPAVSIVTADEAILHMGIQKRVLTPRPLDR